MIQPMMPTTGIMGILHLVLAHTLQLPATGRRLQAMAIRRLAMGHHLVTLHLATRRKDILRQVILRSLATDRLRRNMPSVHHHMATALHQVAREGGKVVVSLTNTARVVERAMALGTRTTIEKKVVGVLVPNARGRRVRVLEATHQCLRVQNPS